jgi:glycosyltransferase involved in cell wall biosynthesis
VVLANGGNYSGADVNWVHSVHTVWPVRDDGAPLLRRVFNRVKKWDARVRERGALRSARLLVANSSKTARDLTSTLGIPSEKVVIIPFGSDPWLPSKENPGEGSRLAFIGALGWDRNKGLDIVLEALSLLIEQGDERTTLLVAGPGTMAPWRQMAGRLGLESRVTFLGMVDDVPALLRNVDLLVSPARYEAYGLAIQEALVAGVPALMSATAGIASSVETAIPSLIVSEHEDPKTWAAAIRHAMRDLPSLRSSVAKLGASLAQRSWQDMAADLVREAEIRAAVRR